MVKRKSSKALASSGHIVSNFPEEACCRATGSPMDSTLSREETASFQVLSDGQAYFNPRGIFKLWREMKRRNQRPDGWPRVHLWWAFYWGFPSISLIATVPHLCAHGCSHRLGRQGCLTSALHCVLSCSVLILRVWIWYWERGLCAVCAFVPGRFQCYVHLLCRIYRWIMLSHCDIVGIINTTVGRG